MADLVGRTSHGMVGVQLHEYEEVHTVPVRVISGVVSDGGQLLTLSDIFPSHVHGRKPLILYT